MNRRLLLLLVGVHLVLLVIQSAFAVTSLSRRVVQASDNCFPESWMWQCAERVAAGEDLYLPLGSEQPAFPDGIHRPIMLPYGPVTFRVAGWVGSVLGGEWRDFQLAGRLLSLGAFLAVLAAVAAHGWRNPDRWLVMPGCVLFLLAQAGLFDFAASFRADLPALAFQVGAVLLFLHLPGARGAAAAGVLAGLAFLTKASLVSAWAGIVPAFLMMPGETPRLRTLAALGAGFVGSVVLGGLFLATPSVAVMWGNILASRHFEFSTEIFRLALSLNATHLALPVAVVVACLFWCPRDPRSVWLRGGVVASFLLQTAALFKVGASAVYWIEPLVLGVLLAAESLRFPGRENHPAAIRVAAVGLAVLLIPALLAARLDGLRLLHSGMPPVSAQLEEMEQLRLQAERLPAPMLTDDPQVGARAAGQSMPLVYDWLLAAELGRAGVLDISGVTRALEERRIRSVVLTIDPRDPGRDWMRFTWPGPWREAILANYHPSAELAGRLVWLPKSETGTPP